ncbi:MAG: hypothetical protein IPJ99_00310 [Betaproteobacteria bacterium]|nr:hypothetical protein [Betaproteobacteria bacterium]
MPTPKPQDVVTAINVLTKVESSAIKLNNDPTPVEVMATALSLSSAITNALALTGLGLGNPNALLNGLNVPMQLAQLNNAIESGNTSAIATSTLSLGAAVAGAIGAVPSPIAAQAKAISVGLNLAALAVGNQESLGNALRDVASAFDDLWNDFSNDWENSALNFTRNLSNLINDLWTRARSWIRRDPLALDLDGDGIETVGATGANVVLFDHDGDGLKTGTGWVKADDGLLVLDRNANGTIDTGAELFGVDTPPRQRPESRQRLRRPGRPRPQPRRRLQQQ